MYVDDAEGMVFRPPSEANSLILRVTLGCSHNACTFCAMYRNMLFQVRPWTDIQRIIEQSHAVYPDARRIFLADGNALALSTHALLAILKKLYDTFPKLTRVTCYAGPRDILRKSAEDLRQLKEAGLHMFYLGIESGDDQVLTAVNKGVQSSHIVDAAKKVMDAGIKLSTMIILGLGGSALSRDHINSTARVINEIQPNYLSALTLMIYPNTPLGESVADGTFTPLGPYEIFQELDSLISQLELTKTCLFRCNHISNLLPLSGTLPKDKARLLAEIQETLDFYKTHPLPSMIREETY